MYVVFQINFLKNQNQKFPPKKPDQFIMSKVTPNLWVKNINHIKWRVLRNELKIKYLVFDKDDTLTLHDESTISSNIKMETFRELFQVYSNNVFYFSNNDNNFLSEDKLEPLKSEIEYEFRTGTWFEG